jgi:copper chaperone CopZ
MVSGMSCANCSSKIENVLRNKPGVIEVAVSSITNKAMILIDEGMFLLLHPSTLMMMFT